MAEYSEDDYDEDSYFYDEPLHDGCHWCGTCSEDCSEHITDTEEDHDRQSDEPVELGPSA